MNERPRDVTVWINRAALALTGVLVVTLVAVWAWQRAMPASSPHWDTASFAPVAPAAPLDSARERWIVAVHPGCPACERHVKWLSERLAARAAPPALGVLVVDEPARPAPLALRASAPAGVWWDSASVWRRQWRRGRYGETYRFDAGGRLLGVTPADVMPDSSWIRP